MAEDHYEGPHPQEPKKGIKWSNDAPFGSTELLLHEQLSITMVEKLTQDAQLAHESPTLLDKLKNLGIISGRSLAGTPSLGNSTSSLNHLSREDVLETINPTEDVTQSTTALSATLITLAVPQTTPVKVPAINPIHQKPTLVVGKRSTPAFLSIKRKLPAHHNRVIVLKDFVAVEALSKLADEYGGVGHVGILDGSYSFFITKELNAALYFKARRMHKIPPKLYAVKRLVCVVGGDPLCSDKLFPELLEQFARYRKRRGWGIIIVGASDRFAKYATEVNWTTVHFGRLRVLNPVTNQVLGEEAGKRIVSQNRKLLDPEKNGVTVAVYSPAISKDTKLQDSLVALYDAWRLSRKRERRADAFITVLDPFAVPGLMTYIYTMDPDGNPHGFAALRRIGANKGFHLDPLIAASNAPKGTSDLLVFASMALLKTLGCSHLSFGYEPITPPDSDTDGMPEWARLLTKKLHNPPLKETKFSGKMSSHEKWFPDEEQDSEVHLIFPGGPPSPRQMVALLRFSNISVRGLAFAGLKGLSRERRQGRKKTVQSWQQVAAEEVARTQHDGQPKSRKQEKGSTGQAASEDQAGEEAASAGSEDENGARAQSEGILKDRKKSKIGRKWKTRKQGRCTDKECQAYREDPAPTPAPSPPRKLSGEFSKSVKRSKIGGRKWKTGKQDKRTMDEPADGASTSVTAEDPSLASKQAAGESTLGGRKHKSRKQSESVTEQPISQTGEERAAGEAAGEKNIQAAQEWWSKLGAKSKASVQSMIGKQDDESTRMPKDQVREGGGGSEEGIKTQSGERGTELKRQEEGEVPTASRAEDTEGPDQKNTEKAESVAQEGQGSAEDDATEASATSATETDSEEQEEEIVPTTAHTSSTRQLEPSSAANGAKEGKIDDEQALAGERVKPEDEMPAETGVGKQEHGMGEDAATIGPEENGEISVLWPLM